LTSISPIRHAIAIAAVYEWFMKLTHRYRAIEAADPSGATCRQCARELRTAELQDMRERAFQLGTFGTLTFDELLCPECFGALPRTERADWARLEHLVDI
jgi:hypothetical protein